MDIIHLLPDSVANQIAAGEVIQRPASCLKELVENSLDAGATYIQIILRDAGSTMLQVIDDGKGMSETDARMAFERHATSKIQTAADLYALHTMGFRGEALASIAAVAKVELVTRRAEDELGTRIEIEGSRVINQEPTQAPVGTSMKIKDLFFNVPARRRFLKTEETERRNLLRDFYRIALVYPSVHFLVVNNDEILLDLPQQSTKERIESIFGSSQRKNFTTQLVDVHVNTPIVNISGFVGKPESANKKPQQYFFVNGRYMQHPYFHKAVTTAYSGMLSQEQNPSYFIYFDIAPDSIDVNIHPTKTEIKFADEQYIWQILSAAVRESLGKFHVAPSLDFNQTGAIDIPNLPTTQVQAPQVAVNTTYNPFHSQSTYQPRSFGAKVPTTEHWEQLYEPKQPESLEVASMFEDSNERNIIDTLQHIDKYILSPQSDGLLLVDQHRAHVCVQYAYFREQIKGQRGTMQQLLFPEIIDIAADEATLLLAVQDDLRYAGFDISQLTKQSFSIDAVPAALNGQNAGQALMNILHNLTNEMLSTEEQLQHTIALTLAEESAIRTGKHLTEPERKDLLQRLFALPEYTFTPNGKCVITLLSNDEIATKFK